MTTDPTPPQTSAPSGGDKNAVLDLAREAIGYEQGLWRTFVDLRKKPKEVLDGYMRGDRKYVSPFKLLTTSLSLWILINGFLIDWYAIWTELMNVVLTQEVRLIAWLSDMDEIRRVALNQSIAEKGMPILNVFCQFAGDLFSKWYVPFAILSTIGGSMLYSRRNPGTSLKESMAILSYSVGSNVPFYLVMSIAFGINIWLGLGLILVMFGVMMAGKSNLAMYAAPKKFFTEDGIAKEKKLMRSVFAVVLLLQILLVAGYFVYFRYWQ